MEAGKEKCPGAKPRGGIGFPYIRQVFDKEGSCISYFICCPQQGQAAVVDPCRDWGRYFGLARSEMVEITRVIDTHIHSDHISGGRNLAKATGAQLCMAEGADVKFDFTPLKEGESIDVGNSSLQVLRTPGHTLESISLIYRDRSRSSDPWGLLTGDTLFVGDVGRQDLDGAGTYEQMYESLFKKLLSFDDYVEVYPAHYAGSDCGSGAMMSFKSVSTIGFERRVNPILQSASLEEFITKVKSSSPSIPPWFRQMKRANRGDSPA